MIDKNKLLEFFENKVKQSGYPLEVKTERILSQNLSVQRHVPYIDKDESKGREIDLVARGQIPFDTDKPKFNKKQKLVIGQVVFIVECKNLPNYGWVFSSGSKHEEELIFPDKVSIADNASPEIINADISRYYTPVQPIPGLFFASGYDEHISDSGVHVKGNQASKQNKDHLFEAINQVTKATRYEVDKMRDQICKKMLYVVSKLDKITAFAVIQPLIVFQGHMYSANVIGEDTKLEEIKYAQIKKQYVSPNYDEAQGTIHVVTYEALPEYLGRATQYYWSASDKMLKEQDLLLASIYEVVEHLQKRMHAHTSTCKGRFRRMVEYTNGETFEGNLNDLTNPLVYFYKSKRAKRGCKFDIKKATYERNFDYCFACGNKNILLRLRGKNYCCESFRTAKDNGVIEVIEDKLGGERFKFLINLIQYEKYDSLINSTCSYIVEQAGIRWCPFCGIDLQQKDSAIEMDGKYNL